MGCELIADRLQPIRRRVEPAAAARAPDRPAVASGQAVQGGLERRIVIGPESGRGRSARSRGTPEPPGRSQVARSLAVLRRDLIAMTVNMAVHIGEAPDEERARVRPSPEAQRSIGGCARRAPRGMRAAPPRASGCRPAARECAGNAGAASRAMRRRSPPDHRRATGQIPEAGSVAEDVAGHGVAELARVGEHVDGIASVVAGPEDHPRNTVTIHAQPGQAAQLGRSRRWSGRPRTSPRSPRGSRPPERRGISHQAEDDDVSSPGRARLSFDRGADACSHRSHGRARAIQR